jgi:hypothetical protein
VTPSSGRNRPGSTSIGNVNITQNGGGAIAFGDHASATSTPYQGPPVVGEAELAALRSELGDLVSSGRARPRLGDLQTIGTALDHLDDLDDELHVEAPRSAVINDVLGKLVATLAGVASVGESVQRVVHVLGSAFGLR